MERQLTRVLARQEVYVEQMEGLVVEQRDKIEELQRENARLENEVHEARHADQEQAEQADPESELGIAPAAAASAEQARAEVEAQQAQAREEMGTPEG